MSLETIALVLAGWMALSLAAGLVLGRVIGAQWRADVAWRNELTLPEDRPRPIPRRAEAAAPSGPDPLRKAA